jgi:hypothetical protein
MTSTSAPVHQFVNGANGNPSSHPDRRRRARLRVHWPLLFRPESGPTIETVTQNLSSDGFYCQADIPFLPGEIRWCTLSVPAYHPNDLSRFIPVQCRVRIVRVEALAETGFFGVGCRIEEYHVPTFATPAVNTHSQAR